MLSRFPSLIRMVAFLVLVSAGTVQGDPPQAMTLGEALAAALQDAPTLAAASQDSETARLRVKESRGDLYPVLVASAGFTRYQEPNIIVPIHEAGVFPPLDDKIYDTTLHVRMPVFDGGKRLARVRSAKAEAEAEAARLDRARLETIDAVARIFVEARLLAHGLELLSNRRDVLHTRRREIAARLAEGRATTADIALIEASLAESRADSLELESQQRQAALRLGRWVGNGGPVTPLIGGRPVGETPACEPPPYGEASPGPARTAPILREAEARVEQSAAGRAAALRSFWPELAVFALLQSRSGGDLDFITEWAAGVTLDLPLFAGGKRLAALQAASSTRTAADYRLAAVRQEQHMREAVTLERWRTAGLRRDAYTDAATAKGRAVAAQREQYREGRLTLADLLAQESELLYLEFAATEMALARRLALLDMHATTGTLTPERARSIVEEES